MEHVASYYAATAHPAPARPPLAGALAADVCVIGGGIAGCATALELAERGYRVVLLEAKRIAWGASGRSGGQAIFGYGTSQASLVAQLGPEPARRLWDLSVDALQWLRTRVRAPRHRLRPALGTRARRGEAAPARRVAATAGRARIAVRVSHAALPGTRRRARAARDGSVPGRAPGCRQRALASAQLHARPCGRRGSGRRADLRSVVGRRDRTRRARARAHAGRLRHRALRGADARRLRWGTALGAGRTDHARRHLRLRDGGARRAAFARNSCGRT